MKKLLLLATILPISVYAQTENAQPKGGCGADTQNFCAGKKGIEVMNCLTANVGKLSPECASVINRRSEMIKKFENMKNQRKAELEKQQKEAEAQVQQAAAPIQEVITSAPAASVPATVATVSETVAATPAQNNARSASPKLAAPKSKARSAAGGIKMKAAGNKRAMKR